jgi:hypothetical protein
MWLFVFYSNIKVLVERSSTVDSGAFPVVKSRRHREIESLVTESHINIFVFRAPAPSRRAGVIAAVVLPLGRSCKIITSTSRLSLFAKTKELFSI